MFKDFRRRGLSPISVCWRKKQLVLLLREAEAVSPLADSFGTFSVNLQLKRRSQDELRKKCIFNLFLFLCDWLTKLAPVSQPMGIQTKSFFGRTRFPALSVIYKYLLRILIGSLCCLHRSVAIGQSNYFGFGSTTLSWKPLYI